MIYLDHICYRLTSKMAYDTMLFMKLLRKLLGISRRYHRPTLAEYQRELLVRQGREEFKKIIDRGLGIPVGLL